MTERLLNVLGYLAINKLQQHLLVSKSNKYFVTNFHMPINRVNGQINAKTWTVATVRLPIWISNFAITKKIRVLEISRNVFYVFNVFNGSPSAARSPVFTSIVVNTHLEWNYFFYLKLFSPCARFDICKTCISDFDLLPVVLQIFQLKIWKYICDTSIHGSKSPSTTKFGRNCSISGLLFNRFDNSVNDGVVASINGDKSEKTAWKFNFLFNFLDFFLTLSARGMKLYIFWHDRPLYSCLPSSWYTNRIAFGSLSPLNIYLRSHSLASSPQSSASMVVSAQRLQHQRIIFK